MISKKMSKLKPDASFSEQQISGLCSFVRRKYPRLDISFFNQEFIHLVVQKRITACEADSFDAYLELINHQPSEQTYFYNALHVNYSEFFRNPLTFALLETVIFPGLIEHQTKKKAAELRIWSAACADGREAYSLAMLLEELKQKSGTDFNYRIFATDVIQFQLEAAQKGVYSATALNNLSLGRINHWFVKSGEHYTINSELKSNIDFSEFDLVSDTLSCPAASIFGDFDLVFCANLLIYYNGIFQNRIIEKMVKCIKSDGLLVTGETERGIIKKYGMREVFSGAPLFKKKIS
jgi:chemotaxis protein methyltransferase CheR